MTKIFIFAVILALAVISSAQNDPPCWGEDCTYALKGNSAEVPPISDIIPQVDREVRRIYWYYLRNAQLLYQANIDTPERFLLFFIYRNIVGTFLTIASWDKQSQVSEIHTFVRLGNGYQEDIQTPYSPVDINPIIISLRLGDQQMIISVDKDGNFVLNDPSLPGTLEENPLWTQQQVDACLTKIDDHVKQAYWYYLRDASIIHTESILTTLRVYAVLTYINIVGTFLVIGSCNTEQAIHVNTFVRLGSGSANPVSQPIVIKPSVIALQQ